MAFNYQNILEEDRALSAPASQTIQYATTCFHQMGIKSVLDLACGNGRDSIPLLEAGFTVMGVDLAAQAIARLQSIYPESFLVADATNLPFPAASFDAVYSFGLLHVFTEDVNNQRQKVMQEIRRVLKPKGVALLTTLWTDTPGCGLPELQCLTEGEIDKLCQGWYVIDKQVVRDRSMTGWDSIHWRLMLQLS